MIRSLTLAALVCLSAVFAQGQQCGFDQVHQQRLAQDPVYAARVQAFANSWVQSQQLAQSSLVVTTPNDTTYEIPVVIHVVRPVASPAISQYNPSDAQLIGMIDYVNQAYAASIPTFPSPTTGGVRFPIKFVLAKRDTACGSTTGIIRVDGSVLPGYAAGGVDHGSGTGASDASVKALSKWNNKDYYNIWIVNKIDGEDGFNSTSSFVAGYAYFPGAGTLDGTIMLAYSSNSGDKTLPHELGHAFNLYHTFQGDGSGSTCPPNTPGQCANEGDQVCDTEPHKRSVFNCPTGTNPCTGISYLNVQHNYMDYSSCADRFTDGQRTRWMLALKTQRPGLMSSMGGVAPSSSSVATACTPTTSPAGISSGYDAGPELVTIQNATGTVIMEGETEGGYASDGNRALVSKTCTQQATLTVGKDYTLTVATNHQNHRVRAWIDYNNDGTFANSEQIYASLNIPSPSTVYDTTFTVPLTATTCVPLRMRVAADRTTAASVNACGPFNAGQAEDYTVFIKAAAPLDTLTLAAGYSNPSCTGTTLSFNVATGATTPNPNFVWYRNNTVVQSGTGTSYTAIGGTLVNGDVVRVKLLYTSGCGTDSTWSNPITIVRTATAPAGVSLALTSGTNPGCPGQQLVFTATPTNGGTAPSYTWRVGSVIQTTGVSGNTFTSSTLTPPAVVSVTLVSNSTCANPNTVSASYASIQFTTTPLIPDVTIAQTAGPNPACANKTVTFTATPVNGGPTPAYQWLINGAPVTGATAVTYTFTPAQSDLVQAILISNNPCVANPRDTSSGVILTVVPADTSRVDIALTKGANPGCKDSLIEFTATTQNLGTAAAITWYVNGTFVTNGPVFSSSTVQDGDVLTVRAIAATFGCRTSDTALSSGVTLTRNAAPASPVISFIGGILIANQQNVQWWGPSGAIAGATGASFHPPAAGLYYATAMNANCPSLPSNKLQVSLLSVGTLDLSGVSIFPNPTSGALTIDWGRQAATGSLDLYTSLGQHLLAEKVQGQTTKTLDLGRFPNGTYFLVIRNAAGEAATVPVTLQR